MTNVIEQYAASLRRYQYHDGTGEMNTGIGMLFFAAIMWLSRVTGGWQSMLALCCYAAISIGLGILLQFNEPQPPPDANIFWFLLNAHSSIMQYYFVMGFIWFSGGFLTLCLYTRQTPKRNLEAE